MFLAQKLQLILYILTFFSILDFVSKSSPEDADNAEETDDIFHPADKLKTAVHSFLRKSANLVNKIYF